MSRLSELIAELCPDGVEYKALGELLDYEQPGKYIVASTDYSDEYSVPVLTAGKGLLLGYTDETEGVYVASDDDPVIIFDDFTTSFHWITYNFKVKSSAMKMLRPTPDCSYCMFRYAYYAMKNIDYAPESHTRQWIGTYSAFRIPVPPIEVQREIVRILDEYTAAHDELVRKLEEETALREQQLSLVRNQLLTFSERERVKRMALGEVGELVRGAGLQKKDFTATGIGCIHYGQIHTRFGTYISEVLSYVPEGLAKKLTVVHPGDVVVAVTSEDVSACCKAVAWVGDVDVVTGGHCVVIRHSLEPKYLSYCFQTKDFFDQKKKFAAGVKVCEMRTDRLARIRIPVPSLEVQREVVRVLDEYTAAHDELAEQLEAERETRERQLSLARNQLLTFPEKVA